MNYRDITLVLILAALSAFSPGQACGKSVLIHRYNFNETSGNVAFDSVGHANGVLNGNAAFDGKGHVVLDGTSGTYVSLPYNLLNGLTDITIEAWITNAVSPDNVALFSFDDGLQDGIGGGYLRFVLHDKDNTRNLFELATSDDGPMLASNPGLGGGSYFIACVYSSSAGIMQVYTNGVLEATMSVSASLKNLKTTSAALGRSPWDADPYLDATIDEFRIWNGARTPKEIADSYLGIKR